MYQLKQKFTVYLHRFDGGEPEKIVTASKASVIHQMAQRRLRFSTIYQYATLDTPDGERIEAKER